MREVKPYTLYKHFKGSKALVLTSRCKARKVEPNSEKDIIKLLDKFNINLI